MFPSGRREWQLATAAEFRDETPTVKSIAFDLPFWPGHLAGQHVDVRLTAADGYQAQRSYSIASPAGSATRIEITVERINDGEVSPFLTQDLAVGDTLELRGPIGGYFTWDPRSSSPLMLIAGGSGVVPLISMLRTRHRAGSKVPARLLYSSRTAESIFYAAELDRLAAARDGFSLIHTLTRHAPAAWHGGRGRVDRDMLTAHTFPATLHPQIFICGPTSFVESVSEWLISLGHQDSAIKTERFGPTGGSPRSAPPA
jgi:ferredoxin-NADP reductase